MMVMRYSISSSSITSSNTTCRIDKRRKDIQDCLYHNFSLVIGPPGSGKSTFARCLTIALSEQYQHTKDIPFLASSKKHNIFFKDLLQSMGKRKWTELLTQLSDSVIEKIPKDSQYKITLIIDGLDELSQPKETVKALANFLRYQANEGIIKRIIITSRPGCIFHEDYQEIQNYFNLNQSSRQKQNLVLTIAPFTKKNCAELVKNLLTLWSPPPGVSDTSQQQQLSQRIKTVQIHAVRFAESPILVNMICYLSFKDSTFNIETASVLDIYDRISRKLVHRYLKKTDIKDEYDEYEDFLGYILRLLAYLMHRVGFNLYGDKKDKDRHIDAKSLKSIIKKLFKSKDWKDTWETLVEEDDVDNKQYTKKEELLDEALGCLYQSGENSPCKSRFSRSWCANNKR